MTDEEKASLYATEDLPDGYTEINYVKKQAYLDGLAEGRKEIERLKAQIEKMMRCANCKHRAVGNDKLPCSECDGKNKWEIME